MLKSHNTWSVVLSGSPHPGSTWGSTEPTLKEGVHIPSRSTWPSLSSFSPCPGWDQGCKHVPHALHAVLVGGHPHRWAFMPPGLSPLDKIPFCSLPPISLPECRCQENKGSEELCMCTLLHSWGRLRAPPGASLDTPTHKHPRNGLPQPLPSWGPAAQLQPVGFQRSHLGCPFLVPSGLKQAGL